MTSIFDIPLVLSVFFFGSIFGNFRVIGGDTEHERLFFEVANLVFAVGE